MPTPAISVSRQLSRRRRRRRAFGAMAVLGLVLSVIIVGLWKRQGTQSGAAQWQGTQADTVYLYRRSDHRQWPDPATVGPGYAHDHAAGFAITSDFAGLHLYHVGLDIPTPANCPPPSMWGYAPNAAVPLAPTWGQQVPAVGHRNVYAVPFAHRVTLTTGTFVVGAHFVELTCPTQLFAAMLALPALIWVVASDRRLRSFGQARPVVCPDCGYDLRATPDLCPECGQSPRAPREPRAYHIDQFARSVVRWISGSGTLPGPTRPETFAHDRT